MNLKELTPMYGLDSFLLDPPFSAIVSIFLIIGCDGLGIYVLRISGLQTHDIKWPRWQAPMLGALVLSVIFYPVALLGVADLSVLRSVGILLVGFSVVHLGLTVWKYRNTCSELSASLFMGIISCSVWKLLFIFLLFGYGILSLSPITNADSLNYHTGVALHILNTGGMPIAPEWFHSRLVGSGEVLNAIGLAVGAEQFGALLQFAGLLGIAGLIYHVESDKLGPDGDESAHSDWRNFISVVAVSAPVLVFLVASAKPQLLLVSMTTLAIATTIYPSRRGLSKPSTLKGYILVCLLVMTASQAKFNYLLGGGVVGFIALLVMYRKSLFAPAIIIGIVSALIIMWPPVLWKSSHFGGGYFDALFKPLPGGWPGTGAFELMLKNVHQGDFIFPFSLVLPSGLGEISTVIGFGIVLFLFLKPNRCKWLKLLISGSIVVIVVGATLGPTNSRSYLEPFYWLLMALALQSSRQTLFQYRRWLQIPIFTQSILVIFMCWYGILTAIPGALSGANREKVMARLANGYEIMGWVDKVLPREAVLLNSHRSMALVPRDSVSLEWMRYAQNKGESLPYLTRIRERQVSHVLLMGGKESGLSESSMFKFFRGCLGEFRGSSYGHLASRNPFNQGPRFQASLFSFDSSLLPDCILSQPDSALQLND